MPVYFHTEDTDFSLEEEDLYERWIDTAIKNKGKESGQINVIFASNRYLLEKNKQYLNHNYFTDVITFEYNEEEFISGDVFISVDQVRENSLYYSVSFTNELERVIIHGVLHLLGLKDSNEEEKRIMRKKEDEGLEVLKSMR